MRKTSMLLCLGLVCITLVGSNAAYIEVGKITDSIDIIEVTGELTVKDIEAFKTKSALSSKEVVAISGRGGSVYAGIEIGQAIRIKGFSTVVPRDEICASACALVWLGGVRRFLSDGAKVGFHAAHNAGSGESSGVGNALAGAYLNSIGLSMAAVAYITMASPNTITWLTAADAKRYGIDVDPLPGRTQVNK